jgi:hypothetical protein
MRMVYRMRRNVDIHNVSVDMNHVSVGRSWPMYVDE